MKRAREDVRERKIKSSSAKEQDIKLLPLFSQDEPAALISLESGSECHDLRSYKAKYPDFADILTGRRMTLK